MLRSRWKMLWVVFSMGLFPNIQYLLKDTEPIWSQFRF